MIRNAKVGFIGAGNMANALITGILKSQTVKDNNISISDIDESKLLNFKKLGIKICRNNCYIVENCDIIVLAIKPNVYKMVLEEISQISNLQEKVFISIAAGISISYIKKFFNQDIKVIRVMPNTPALVGEGMTVIAYKPPTTTHDADIARFIFECVGKVELIGEKYMEQIVAINGSSPAYVYMMIEAMADAGVRSGLTRSLSYKLAAQSILGSAKMVLETNKHPGELKDAVCSPGGTTINAVYHLERTGFRASLMKAMQECTKKAIEIKEKYM